MDYLKQKVMEMEKDHASEMTLMKKEIKELEGILKNLVVNKEPPVNNSDENSITYPHVFTQLSQRTYNCVKNNCIHVSFSSPASTPATFNLKCKCPRSGAGTPRVCGWYSGKMGGEVTQTTFDGIACEAAPTEVTTTAVVTATTTAVVGDTTTAVVGDTTTTVAGDTTTVVVGDTTTAVVGDTTTAVVGDTTTAVVGDTTAMGDTTTGMGDTTTAVVEATTTTVAAETTTRPA